MIDWETNGAKLYKQLEDQRKYNEEVKKQGQFQDCMKSVQMQLQQHEAEKQKRKMENDIERQMRAMQEKEAQEADYQKKLQDKERQRLYNQALTYQVNMHELQKHNFGKMTFQEKRLNKDDLVTFKKDQTEIHAMIPGIHNNQAGGAHLKRTKLRETSDIPGKLKISMSQPSLHSSYGATDKEKFL